VCKVSSPEHNPATKVRHRASKSKASKAQGSTSTRHRRPCNTPHSPLAAAQAVGSTQYSQFDMLEEDWGQSKFQWGGELGPTLSALTTFIPNFNIQVSVCRHLLSDFIPSFSDHSSDATLVQTPADSRRAPCNSSDRQSCLQAV
jgi:hypothetical protein